MFGLNWTASGGDPRAHRHQIGGAWGGYSKTKDGQASGLIAGTMVATELGWRPVESIVEGDLVLTFDGGMQPVRGVIRGQLWHSAETCPEQLWPLHVPAGAIGNTADLMLPPEQIVVLESDAADQILEDPFAPIQIDALEGYQGIRRKRPEGEIEIALLQFDQDEIVFAENGALIMCPCVKVIDLARLMTPGGQEARYRALSGNEAALLVECLLSEERMESGIQEEGLIYAA